MTYVSKHWRIIGIFTAVVGVITMFALAVSLLAISQVASSAQRDAISAHDDLRSFQQEFSETSRLQDERYQRLIDENNRQNRERERLRQLVSGLGGNPDTVTEPPVASPSPSLSPRPRPSATASRRTRPAIFRTPGPRVVTPTPSARPTRAAPTAKPLFCVEVPVIGKVCV